MKPIEQKRLIEVAKNVRRNAYAAYSGYHVGAALIDEVGRVHAGCNVENSAFPEGTCAEANAIAAMVAAGGRRIAAIAVVGGRDAPESCTPCGGCRQKIAEFADDATRVLLLTAEGTVQTRTVSDLLPETFRFER